MSSSTIVSTVRALYTSILQGQMYCWRLKSSMHLNRLVLMFACLVVNEQLG